MTLWINISVLLASDISVILNFVGHFDFDKFVDHFGRGCTVYMYQNDHVDINLTPFWRIITVLDISAFLDFFGHSKNK